MPLKAAAKSTGTNLRQIAGVTLCVGLALALGGCAGSGQEMASDLLSSNPKSSQQTPATATAQTELEKATGYWGEKFSKTPNNLEYALSYARNLKAMGRKREALAVLQQASTYHGQNRELASEYGRLALALDQVQVAKQVLSFADDPTKPDWRVISARGTVLAKEGNHKDAIPLFERALTLSNQNPAVMNNLAMAYALDGRAVESERLLRQATSKGNNSAKVQKNLALVLGLQGKYDEAKVVGGRVLTGEAAQSDTALVQQMVRLDPQPYSPASPAPTAAPSAIAQSHLKPAGASTVAAAAPLRSTVQPAATTGSWTPQVATAAPPAP